MRKVSSDNHFYGEFLVDRLVWVEVKTKGINIDGETSTDNKLELNYKAILQITSWRFIFTVLDESISTHKSYWDFSWSDIEKISSSISWLTLTLKDKCIICIKFKDAQLTSIKIWAFSEAIKTEAQNLKRKENGNVWAQGPSINLTCETVIPYIGEWTRMLEKYGIVCTRGERPKRLEWDCRFVIDIVKIIFSKKNLSEKSVWGEVQNSSVDANALSNNDLIKANELLQLKADPIDYASNILECNTNENDKVKFQSELDNIIQSTKIDKQKMSIKTHRKKRFLSNSFVNNKKPFGIKVEYGESLEYIQDEAEKFLTQLNENGVREDTANNANAELDNISNVKPLIQSSNANNINKSKQDMNLEKEISYVSTKNPAPISKFAGRSGSDSAYFVGEKRKPDSIKSIIQGIRNKNKYFYFIYIFISAYSVYILFYFLRLPIRLPTLAAVIFLLFIILFLLSHIER